MNYRPYREDPAPLQLNIPWDKNTARGFAVSLVFMAILLASTSLYEIPQAKVRNIEITSIPLELINFGDGDGTGMSKGNLTKEGRAHKGKLPPTNLHDARVAAQTKRSRSASNNDIEDASEFNPVESLASKDNNKNAIKGSHSTNTGSPNGSDMGTGIGDKGSGRGLGMGFGDIQWGGGGNRTVLYKREPKYPDGLNTDAQIRIRFVVAADGTVTSMIPLQKGDPVLEKSALNALRYWKFNPLKTDKEMFGIITFTFRVS